jgi:putative PIN family toxin of toxin-antitoxin system
VIRVVIDTNVIVSATLRSGGLPEAVLKMAVAGEVLFFVSEHVLAEYEEVLRRPRFAVDRDKLSNAIATIRSASLVVHPETRVTAALDPDDNIFLECAQAADAITSSPAISNISRPPGGKRKL